MSSWLLPAVVATLASAIVLALVYLYLWHQDRERSLAIWALAWAVYALRFDFMLLAMCPGASAYWITLNQLCSLASGLLLLWGALDWTGKRLGLRWLLPGLFCALWILAYPTAVGRLSIARSELMLLSLPTFTFLGIVNIAAGLRFLRATRSKGSHVGRLVVCWSLVLWGIHKMDYPFLRGVEWFAPWGYTMGALLGLISAIGIVLVYFECTREQLSRSREDFRNLVQQANSVVLRMDLEGRILFANDFALRLFGYTKEELVGRFAVGTVVPEHAATGDDLRQIIHQIVHDPETYLIHENENRRKDDSRLWMSWSNNVVRDPQGNPAGLLAVGHDTTALHEAQLAREAMEEQMRRSQRLETVGQLAGGVAHDFNNLLQAIQGYNDLAREDLESGRPVADSLEEIARATDRATALVRQLLTFSRRDALQPRDVDVNDLIAGLMRMLERLIGEHIELRLDASANLPHVYVDPGQIEQAVTNLVVNARDAMPEGGQIAIHTGMADRTLVWNPPLSDVEADYVAVRISDTGCGIDPAVRERMFEPFYTTKGVGKGTGLGLSTVYGIVVQHDGAMAVQSEPGKGTTFSICLPCARGEGPSDTPQRPGRRDSRFHALLKGRTALIAEDEDQARALIGHILDKHGCRVLAAADGKEALDLFRRHVDSIDIAILDIVMYGLNGVELCRTMRQSRPALPVLFCSGYTERTLGGEARSIPGARMLSKPFSDKLLLEAVEGCLVLGRSRVDKPQGFP